MEPSTMGKIFNLPERKKIRQTLREDMPKAEVILWARIKGKRMLGYKFRRQQSVGPYILDFYCPELRLASELDGDSHFKDDGPAHDKKRTKFIEDKEITMIRFQNNDVFGNTDDVLKTIENIIGDITKDN